MGEPLGLQRLQCLPRRYFTRQVTLLQAEELAGLPTDRRPEPLTQPSRQTQSLLGA